MRGLHSTVFSLPSVPVRPLVRRTGRAILFVRGGGRGRLAVVLRSLSHALRCRQRAARQADRLPGLPADGAGAGNAAGAALVLHAQPATAWAAVVGVVEATGRQRGAAA